MAFSFKGISADTYGLKVELLQPPQRAGSQTEIIRIPGRPEPLVKSRDEFENTELTFEAIVTDTSKVREIFAWLRGEGQLIYDDEPDKYYYAVSNQLISVTRISDEICKFSIRFTCLPFAYSVSNAAVENTFEDTAFDGIQRTKTVSVTVDGSFPCEPVYKIDFAGRLEISVNGTDTFTVDTGKTDGIYDYTTNAAGSTTVYTYIVPRKELYIDTALRIAYILDGTVKRIVNELTYGMFPMLSVGTNKITLTLIRGDTFSHTDNDGTERKYLYQQQNLYAFDVKKNERWL